MAKEKKVDLEVKEVTKHGYDENGKLVYVETYTPVKHKMLKRVGIGASIAGAGILGYVIGTVLGRNFDDEEGDDEI